MKAIRSDEENPSPKEKPSYWDVLMSLGPSGLRDAVKATIVRNTHPFGYGGVDNEPIKRLVDIMREPESGSPAHRKDGESLVTQAQLEREALLSMLMGFGGNLPSSDYREGAYRSPVTERSLKMLLDNPETRDIMVEQMLQQPDYHDNGGYGNVLGSFTVNKGSDDRGEYIDYYDVWDLNPISAPMKAKYSERTTNAVRAVEDFLTRDVIGMKAPEIYGRVYFDELDSGMRPMRTIKDKNAQ